MTLVSICGPLVVGGFRGTTLPASFARALREHRRGGVILFGHNVEGTPRAVASLAREVHAMTSEPPFVSIDQEGGRVARLRKPLLEVPSMRDVASWRDVELAERIARTVGTELSALGITLVFAPVLDVNTCPENPVIGDRAFGSDPLTCSAFGTAWIRGLQSAGVLACGKHFPGHGDTSKDSHFDLPVVGRPRDHIDRIELAPFRAAIAEGVAALMTAHVVYPALDPILPATLSRASCTGLRGELGFDGLLVSDDLEMKAIAARWSIEDASIQAIGAGCDTLLVCASDENQERAVEALVHEAERSPTFRARCEQACVRGLDARRRSRARPLDDDGISRVIGSSPSRDVADAIRQRMAG